MTAHPGASVLTVGAGASALVGHLLADGHVVIAVDIAQAALDQLAASIDDTAADRLRLIASDVRALEVAEPVDVWHDRAVFHFLVDPADQASYVCAAAAAVRHHGHLVIATFAPDGPSSCSGLAVQRHDADSLARSFAPHFVLIDSFETDHRTPSDVLQRFTHALLRRR